VFTLYDAPAVTNALIYFPARSDKTQHRRPHPEQHKHQQCNPDDLRNTHEHPYHIDHSTTTAKHIDAFMLNINREEINRRAEPL
jgi:hypothetical protein